MTIPVLNATGGTVNLETPNANGRAAAAGSRPVALSTEDFAAVEALGSKLDDANTALAAIETAASDTTTPVPVFASGREYEFVPASTSFAALGATGAVGDELDSIIFVPLTTSPGEVKLRDGTGGTARTIFKGGASSVGDLKPFEIGLSLKALAAGGWFLDTGADIQCFAAGNFT